MDALRLKLKWLMGIRVALVSLMLGVWIYLQLGRNVPALTTFYSLIVATYLLTILYAILLGRLKDLRVFAFVQIFVDILFETVLVSLTGAAESPFTLLYVISISSAGALLSRPGGLLMASMASIFYGAIVDLQYYKTAQGILSDVTWLPYTTLSTPEIFYNLAIYLLGFLMLGYLTGTMAEQLETAGKRLEKKDRDLIGLREFHRCILESIDSGVFTTDSAGRITSFNRRAAEVMGYSDAEVYGKLWWEIFGWPAWGTAKSEPLADLPRRLEQSARRKDGSRLIVGMSLSPLVEGGVRTGIVGVFQDLTPLKKMEERVRRKQWLATLGELSAGMAHEVRNPLAALSGAMQVLRKDLSPGDSNQPLLDLALRETERLNGIVSDFLLYARPRRLNLQPCDANDVVEETVRMLQQTAPYDKSVTFVRRLSLAGVTTLLDPDLMRQVCWNLGLNACQAMPQGGTLTVSTRRLSDSADGGEGESVEIVFEDTGSGIPESDLEKIFFPFFTTKEGGTGLGLALVHQVMVEHRGSVSVESNPGQGTRVRLRLPVQDHAEMEET